MTEFVKEVLKISSEEFHNISVSPLIIQKVDGKYHHITP
jgi:hypothetical protein